MLWWIKKAHFSWVLTFSCFGFVAGVYMAMYLHLGLPFLIVGAGLVILAFVSRARLAVAFGAAGAVFLGLWLGGVALGERSVYNELLGKEVVLRGSVREDPGASSGGRCVFQINDIYSQYLDRKLSGVLISTAPCLNVKRGDILTLRGEFKEGIGSYVGSMYRAEVVKAERPYPGDVGRRVRDWFGDNVRQAVKEPEVSLGMGFLAGQKSSLPDDLSDAMKVAGLTHIVVASGYNLTILVRLSRKLFVRVSRYLSVLIASAMVLSFMAVTGMSPSMARAGLVSGLSLLVWYYGGVFHPITLLAIAMATTVALQPSYVWGDLGWQLSFMAFFGVMILSPLLQSYFFGKKEPGMVRQVLGETLSAHIVTLPIVAIGFGVTSNVAVLANLLIVPLVPLAMLLTFTVGLLVIVGLPYFFISTPLEWLLGYMINVAKYLSKLEWAQSEVVLPPWAWLVYVLMLVFCCIWMNKSTKDDFRRFHGLF